MKRISNATVQKVSSHPDKTGQYTFIQGAVDNSMYEDIVLFTALPLSFVTVTVNNSPAWIGNGYNRFDGKSFQLVSVTIGTGANPIITQRPEPKIPAGQKSIKAGSSRGVILMAIQQ